MSFLAWLDFSDAERRRALQVVEALGQPETRDELGLGAIRDAFADALFPGMSTIQRRARYFLFVPWTYLEAEDRYRGRPGALEHTKWAELRFIEVLLKGEDTDGVIGSRARGRLQQLPSIIYWQGLSRWGIRKVSGSREQWGRFVQRSGELATNDDGELDPERSWWDPDLVDPPDDWERNSTLALLPAEADYLRDRIREACPDTALSVLAERAGPWDEVAFPWHLDIPELTPGIQRVLNYAQWFSEVMNGAALVYNRDLADQTEDPEDRELYNEYAAKLATWAGNLTIPRESLSLEEMWVVLGALGSRHTRWTRIFVETWFSLAADPERAAVTEAASELIRSREREVKGTQARLCNEAARKTWSGAAGVGQLDYRWSSAQRQLLDIVSAGSH